MLQAFAAILDPVEDFAALLVVDHVGDQRVHLAVGDFVGEFVARSFQCGRVARDDQHFGAEAEQFARDRASDAGTAAGHQRQLSVQPPAIGIHVRCLPRFGVA